MDTIDTATLDLGSFDFTPEWARKAAGVSSGRWTPDKDDKRPANRQDSQGQRKPFGERKSFGDDRRKGPGRNGFQRTQMRPDPVRPLDAEIKILPETKALGTIMRKLMLSPQAFKLKELAYFLLDNPATVLLKITPRETAGGEKPRFHQCKACSFASPNRDDVVAHALAAHLGDYYETKEIEVEPPKGNFNCVAKCGLSGVLLGPPNVHEFNSVVREMIRTRYPNMSEADYRAKIEMVRDPEAVEEWRKGATKKTVLVPKGAGEDAPTLTREQAEAEFRRTFLDNLITEPKVLMMTAEAALASPLKPLVYAVKDALQAERRAPYSMIFALRGAFRHRKMFFFRANDPRGPEFVIGHELKEFDAAHAIPELAQVAAFIAENPCRSQQEIAAISPDAARHLAWLVSTGHIVSFTNGVFSAVEKYPKYGPQWRNKKPRPAAEAAVPTNDEAAAPAETKSAASAANEAETPAPAPETPAPASVETPNAEAAVQENKEESKDESAPKLAE